MKLKLAVERGGTWFACFLSARVGTMVILLEPSTHSSGCGDLQSPDMLFHTLTSRQERQHVGGVSCLGLLLGSYFWELGSAHNNQPNLASLQIRALQDPSHGSRGTSLGIQYACLQSQHIDHDLPVRISSAQYRATLDCSMQPREASYIPSTRSSALQG